ncbi:MAG: efflux RND transporter periplasmic adaptor subunit [Candidatus Omnitrophica bacterium]|nr:efflux RND transporter periplasmic adaptor subunit [Candidatus Omnitrophota bacterium]
MRILKLSLIILISFGLGAAVSRSLSGKAVPKAEKAEVCHEEAEELKLSERAQELIALNTEKARLGTFSKSIPVIGEIAEDAETSVHVVSPVRGEITETKAGIGSVVKEGDVLCRVSEMNGETAIHEVKAPIAGTVIGAFAKVKDMVDTVSSVYTIADLTKLSATFDVYEKDISGIKLGQKVTIHSIAYPDKVFEGAITFISHRVDENSNTIKVRALVKNPDNFLKLGMFVNADIMIESEGRAIVLPKGAVYTMNSKKVVYIKTASDKFEAREIKVRDENTREVVLAEGVSEGEEVVVENGFLLKSESLRSRMGDGCAE